MMITATEAKVARTKLGLSQAAVAKATGIPRNIMSAFELQKIELLEGMQYELMEFFASRGMEAEMQDAANDSIAEDTFAEPAAQRASDTSCDSRVLEGFCVSPSIDGAVADFLLAQIHELENEIFVLLPLEVEDEGIFFQSVSEDALKTNHRLTLMHAKWACLVRELQGRPSVTVADLVDGWPETQANMLAQKLNLQLVKS